LKKSALFLLLACLALAPAPSRAAAPSLAELERKAEANPKDPGHWFNFGFVAFQAKDFAKAESALARTVSLSPKDAEAWELYGAVLLENKKAAKAVEALEKATGLDGKRVVAWQRLAQARLALGGKENMGLAVEAYGKAAKAKPQDGRLWLNQGLLLAKLGEDGKALAALEKAAGLKGGEAASRSLCLLYNKKGDDKKAEAACRKAAESGGGAEEWYNLGFVLSKRKDPGARAAFNAAVKLDPRHAPSLYNLGWLDYEAGHAEAALKNFQAAIDAREGSYPEAQYNAGVVLGDLGRWEQAAALYRAVLKKDPADEDSKANLEYVVATGAAALLDEGRDAYERGNFDQARKAWERTLALDPENADAQSLLSTVKAKDAKTKAAAAARQDAKKDVAKKLQAEDNKIKAQGLAALKAGKHAEAVKLLSFYLKKNPKDRAAEDSLFKARSSVRQKVDALLQEAARVLVEDDRAKAAKLAAEALALDPGNARAKKLAAQAGDSKPAAPAGASPEQLRKDYYAGVEQYLKGDLAGAIGTWKKVLAADAGQLDARRSLSQAELELVALKKHAK
jgi:tetratricopeptide (TPR) repeat protein